MWPISDEGAVLPSANLAYSLSQKVNLRAAYYASVNRPEFRELAPFAFFAFDKNAQIKGNKDLKIAQLNNYDLRLEFYPSGTPGALGRWFLQNHRQSGGVQHRHHPAFHHVHLRKRKIGHHLRAGIRSAQEPGLPGSSDRLFQDISLFSQPGPDQIHPGFRSPAPRPKLDRPLQGQSPYVVNAGIQYESVENGWFGSVIVNRVGRRIAFVGVDPKFGDTRQDIFEAPRTVLDMQVGKNIGQFNLKFTLGDLFHQDQIFYQDTDQNGKFEEKSGGDRQMFRYTNGLTSSLTIGYTIK